MEKKDELERVFEECWLDILGLSETKLREGINEFFGEKELKEFSRVRGGEEVWETE